MTDQKFAESVDWSDAVYAVMRSRDVRHMTYVPDAGLSRLIALGGEDPEMTTVTLTTEEEGVPYLSGAWLGGQRGVQLMQSSGVGNCVNMLSLIANCRFPFFALVTMRGEWGEFNPWQIPMSRATSACFDLMGVLTFRVERAEELPDVAASALDMAFEGDQAVAVMLSQRMIGRKKWTR